MSDWTSVLGSALGYALAAFLLVSPIIVLLLVMRTRWFKRGHRVRWAGEKLVYWWRDPMSELGPLGEEPPRKRRQR